MGDELSVTVYLDPEFSLPPIVKTVRVGGTVAELKGSLAQDDPTGQTRVEDFDFAHKLATTYALDSGSVITQDMLELVICAPRQGWEEAVAPAEQPADAGQHWEEQQKWAEWAAAAQGQSWEGQNWEGQSWEGQNWEEWARAQAAAAAAAPDQLAPAEETALEAQAEEEAEPPARGPCGYRVVQGPLVKKPGAQGPTGSKIIKLNRKVGSVVKTTGQSWVGPSGGQWVELDSSVEKPGWMLVEGPGFDLPGPLLDPVRPDEAPAVVLSLFSAIQKTVLCEVLVRQSATIDMVKSWIILRRKEDTPKHKIWCTKATPEDVDGKYFLKTLSIISTGTVLEKLEFKDGETMVFVIIGADGEMC